VIRQNLNNKFGIAESLNNIGLTYQRSRKYDLATEFLLESIKIKESINNIAGLAASYESLGDIGREQKDYTKADVYYKKALEYAISAKSKKWQKSIYSNLYQLEKERNNYAKSLDYFEKFIEIKDEAFGEDKFKEIKQIEAKFKLKQKENELSIMESEITAFNAQQSKQRVLRNSLIVGLIFTLILGIVFFNWQKTRTRKTKQLQSAKLALTETDLENLKLKEKELENELEFKNKELASYTINFIQKNNLFEELVVIKDQLANSSGQGLNESLKKLDQLVKKNYQVDKDWDDFKLYFEKIHSGFFNAILKISPDLSNSDLKLCTLLRLNLNTKEAANILGISPESVKTARYRIRKKLNLVREENLVSYLMAIGD